MSLVLERFGWFDADFLNVEMHYWDRKSYWWVRLLPQNQQLVIRGGMVSWGLLAETLPFLVNTPGILNAAAAVTCRLVMYPSNLYLARTVYLIDPIMLMNMGSSQSKYQVAMHGISAVLSAMILTGCVYASPRVGFGLGYEDILST